jgi:hypothetical protein
MVESKKGTKSRLPYEKPRLRTIPLVAEEVLAVRCKQALGAPGKNKKGCGNISCITTGGS